MILPPVRPEFVSDGGPRVVGGYGYGPGLSRREFGYGYYDDYYAPTRYTLRDAGQVYWDWKGESEAKVILVYTRGNNPTEFTHELLFGRRKVK
jgi:hypothetical protein